MKELPKTYDFKASERKWKEAWEANKTYAFDRKSNKPVYSIDTPPPTVSGKMHIGHSFSYAHEDFIARFHRMRGKNVFYPFGTDDNGLATDRLVEKTKKVKAKSMKREDYLSLAHRTVQEILPGFIEDWKTLGMSCDFTNPYSTISEAVQKASQKGFLELHKKGLVYRKETPVSWCPHCQTAIAQAEFENVDMTSHFNDIIFKSGAEDLIVATTRPELLPACVGLFYHPADERYQHLKGSFAKVPLFGHEVPIIADETVAMDKGTGLMMCCTFGDKEDIEKWHKYDLPLRVVITKDGRMNETTGTYAGTTLKEARNAIKEDLEREGLLISSKPITHPVNVHERCGTDIEFLNTYQWFVNVLDHKQALIKAADDIDWHPPHMKTRYVHWVENLNWDWCISRQRHFGIPFPVWYTNDGDVILPREEQLPIDPLTDRPAGHQGELIPEHDVIDTWATSSLTPQLALGWADNNPLFKKAFPMDVRPQAHDIIRTWAFYTITRGVYHEKKAPWKHIMISGFVLDPKGNKMSKSRGNVINPQDVMDKYGADALRYWAAGSKLGDDQPYMEKDVQTGAKTVNKLWNASRFALMQLADYDGTKPKALLATDKWMLSKLQRIIKESTATYESYEYAKAKSLVDNFFWNTFCDHYLEIIKDRIYNPSTRGEDAKRSAQHALHRSLQTILKLFAPIMPYVTEEIYSYAYAKDEKDSIHTSDWPAYEEKLMDEAAEQSGDALTEVVNHVRRKKSEANVSLKTPVTTLALPRALQKALRPVEEDLKAVTNAQTITYEGDELAIELGEQEKK
ncbi:valine--tRNA ligase [Candidatus Woesearchaeota archaeon]|nr:valine--tRNA ligase [Candidatus Woesearchaeota archaeon]